jgi:hypothetical protein
MASSEQPSYCIGIGYQGNDKRAEISENSIIYRVAIRPVKHRELPNTPDRLLDPVEMAKANIKAKV